MNMMVQLTAADPVLTRTEVAGLVALAARTAAPLWPLESAIAVNPLAGFEGLPFEAAVRLAAQRFGARRSLPLGQWRKLLAAGKLDERSLRDAAIRKLGGLNAAFELIGPNISRLDLLMARLLHLPVQEPGAGPAPLPADAAFIAKWCAAFFDQGQASSPMPNRELGLYRAVLAAIGHDPDFRALTGESGRHLLLSVPRDPLEAIAEGLSALGIPAGQEGPKLEELVARLPGWAGHIRWRNEHADPEIAAASPAGMADLLALWLLLERGGAVSAPARPQSAGGGADLLAHHFVLLDKFDTSVKEEPAEDLKDYTKQNTRKPKPITLTGSNPFASLNLEEAAGFEPEIDLHIEKLMSGYARIDKGEILRIQMVHFHKFLDKAIRLGAARVFVIHGVGEGKLRETIADDLKRHPHVVKYKNEFHHKYGYGATEVIFE